jgi:transcriptional regulator with XRE-family HTH domain
LAAKVGLQGASIVLMEKGRRKPSYDVLGKLADVFGCQVDYLMGREAPEPPPKWLADLLPDLEALDKRGQESVKALVRGLKKT